MNVLTIDKEHIAPQMALDCRPGLGKWAQLSHSLCFEYLWHIYNNTGQTVYIARMSKYDQSQLGKC